MFGTEGTSLCPIRQWKIMKEENIEIRFREIILIMNDKQIFSRLRKVLSELCPVKAVDSWSDAVSGPCSSGSSGSDPCGSSPCNSGPCGRDPRGSTSEKEMEAGPGACILLTDREDICVRARAEGICCIGIEKEAESRSGALAAAAAVMTVSSAGLPEIDEQWLEMQYCHFHGIPFVVHREDQWCIRESIPEDLAPIRAMMERTGLHSLTGADDSSFSELPRETDEANQAITGEFQAITDEAFQAMTGKSYQMWGFGLWTVEKKGSKETPGNGVHPGSEILGWCGLYPSPLPEGGVELGYMIAPEYQRQGIGFQVCRRILFFASEQLEIETILLRTDHRNAAGAALARKLGFVPVKKTGLVPNKVPKKVPEKVLETMTEMTQKMALETILWRWDKR